MLSQHPHLLSRFTLVVLIPLILFLCFVAPASARPGERRASRLIADVRADTFVFVGDADAQPNAGRVAPNGAGRITGRVISQATEASLPGIQVSACQWSDGHWSAQAEAVTQTDGVYALDGLPTGLYRVRFVDPTGRYQTRFYGKNATGDYGPEIRVISGQTTPAIDVQLVLAPASQLGQVNGKVTDRISGAPLPNIGVEAWACGGSCAYGDYTTTTGSDGSYHLDLHPDTYQLTFVDSGQIYARAIVDDIVVKAGQAAQADAQLSIRGGISGQVTAASTGELLAGIEVNVYSMDEGGMAAPAAITDAQGVYRVRGLETGYYQVTLRDPEGRYQPGAVLTEDGKQPLLVPVAAESITPHVDAALVEGGNIAGRVTDAQTGLPLAGIQVRVMGAEVVTTGADGTYASGGLAAGAYLVLFDDPNDQYPTLYYSDTYTWGRPENTIISVVVTAAHTTGGIDAHMLKYGQIAGRITDKDRGKLLSGIHVALSYYFWDSDPVYHPRGWIWRQIAEQDSTPDGQYHFDRLLDGAYRVSFTDPQGVYHAETFEISKLSEHPDAANTHVALDRQERVTGHIAGAVTARWSGAPAAGVEVSALQFTDFGWSAVGSAQTDTVGAYDIVGLAPGAYRVRFSSWEEAYRLARFEVEYYDDVLDVNSADDVTVVAGMVVNDIDAELIERSRIVGRVYLQATGEPLADNWLRIRRADGEGVDARTDATGRYDSGPLLPGDYTVTFLDYTGPVGNINRYGERQASAHVADEHEELVSVDFAIEETRGQIAGRVVDAASGRPLDSIQIECRSKGSSSDVYCGHTDYYGKYTTRFLTAGVYQVKFVDPSGRYLTEVYDQAQSWETGADVIVVAGELTGDINAALAGYPRLSGRVTARDTGSPLANISVLIWRQNGQDWKQVQGATTGSDGTWISAPLVAGAYRVGFFDYTGGYQAGYFASAGTLEEATDINVSGDQVIAGIDAQLRRSSYITGQVTDQRSGAAIPNVHVNIIQRSPNAWYTSRWVATGANGEYTTGGLPSGVYWLGFSDPAGRYLDEYYADAPDLTAATAITISSEHLVTRIDAALARVNQIHGTVTDRATGTPLSGIWVTLWHLDAEWRHVVYATTGPDGAFEFSRVLPGSYRVGFSDPADRYRSTFYADGDSVEAATDITITVDQSITGIDAALLKVAAEGTPTATPTAEPTATVTPTPPPTSEWRRDYLPVILR